jgi:hypothetical protein
MRRSASPLLFLDGVYVDGENGLIPRFRRVKAPTGADLTQLTHTIAHRVGRFLERQGLLERDAENSYLSGDGVEAGPLDQLLGHSMMYREVRMPREAGCRERPRIALRLGLTWQHEGVAFVREGRMRGARCSLYKPCPTATSRSLTMSARWPDSRCTQASRRGPTTARNWNDYAATSRDPRCWKSGCRC